MFQIIKRFKIVLDSLFIRFIKHDSSNSNEGPLITSDTENVIHELPSTM